MQNNTVNVLQISLFIKRSHADSYKNIEIIYVTKTDKRCNQLLNRTESVYVLHLLNYTFVKCSDN